jgi:glycosyltransferase involved in cell wall biosynthesis
MKFSVIVPVYNKVNEVCYVLQALTQQTVPLHDFEVVVVDDGSVDGSFEIIEAYKNMLNLKTFRLDAEGRRASRSRNCGIDNSDGDIVVLLDSDVLPKNDFLDHHQFFLDLGYDISLGLVAGTGISSKLWQEKYPAIEVWKTNDNMKIFEWLSSKPELADSRLEWIGSNTPDVYASLPAPYAGFWTGNVAFRRCIVDKIGGFDINFVDRGNEDIEFGYRCWKAGAKIGLNCNVMSLHIPHPKNHLNYHASDTFNSFEFIKKFPELEVELMGVLTCMQINGFLLPHKQWANQNLQRPQYLHIPAMDKLVNTERGNLLVGFGFFAKDVLRNINAEMLVDPSPINSADLYFDSKKRLFLTGAMTPFLDKTFDTGVITDYYRTVPNYLWEPMLRETTRICKNTIIIHSKFWEPIPTYNYRNNPNRNLYNEDHFEISIFHSDEEYDIYSVVNSSSAGFQQVFIDKLPENVENEGTVMVVNRETSKD